METIISVSDTVSNPTRVNQVCYFPTKIIISCVINNFFKKKICVSLKVCFAMVHKIYTYKYTDTYTHTYTYTYTYTYCYLQTVSKTHPRSFK